MYKVEDDSDIVSVVILDLGLFLIVLLNNVILHTHLMYKFNV